MDSRMLVVGTCTGYIIVVVVITLCVHHGTTYTVARVHSPLGLQRSPDLCGVCVVSTVLISRYNSPTLVICEC